MEHVYTLWIISIVIWIIPPFKQFKSKYFYYFGILALTGVVSYFFKVIIHVQSNLPLILSAFLVIVALQNTSFRKRYNRYQLPVMFLILTIIAFINHRMFEIYILTFLQIIILFYILYHFFYHIIRTKELNMFFITLVLFQTLNVFEYINIVALEYDSAFYFVVT